MASAPEGAELVREDPAGFVRALKGKPGGDIIVMGGGELGSALIEGGAVDEIGLNLHPVLLGGGTPAFPRSGVASLWRWSKRGPIAKDCVFLRYTVHALSAGTAGRALVSGNESGNNPSNSRGGGWLPARPTMRSSGWYSFPMRCLRSPFTLLVIEIHAPHIESGSSDGAYVEALIRLIPNFVGYAVSFGVIAAFWAGHHRAFCLAGRFHRRVAIWNFLLLGTIAFVPFVSGFASAHPRRPRSGRFLLEHGCC
jgi:hypothetical protein